jgi:yecA family protein
VRSYLAALESFLESRKRPEGTFRYHELQGFLFAVTSSPEMIKSSDWLPMIFNDQEASYASLQEAQQVIGEIMALYNAINASAMSERATLPADCAFRQPVLANLDDDAPISQWSRGFSEGHQWLEEIWEPYLAEEMDEEFGVVLLTLTFFGSRQLASAYLAETRGTNLKGLAKQLMKVFPDAVAEYAWLGRTIDRVRREHGADSPR